MVSVGQIGPGTPEYIAPEGSGGTLHDVYSSGILLYLLLTGEFLDRQNRQMNKSKLSKLAHANGIRDDIKYAIVSLVLGAVNPLLDFRLAAADAAKLARGIVEVLVKGS